MAAPWGSLTLPQIFALSSLAQLFNRVRSIPEHFFVILSQRKTCCVCVCVCIIASVWCVWVCLCVCVWVCLCMHMCVCLMRVCLAFRVMLNGMTKVATLFLASSSSGWSCNRCLLSQVGYQRFQTSHIWIIASKQICSSLYNVCTTAHLGTQKTINLYTGHALEGSMCKLFSKH